MNFGQVTKKTERKKEVLRSQVRFPFLSLNLSKTMDLFCLGNSVPSACRNSGRQAAYSFFDIFTDIRKFTVQHIIAMGHPLNTNALGVLARVVVSLLAWARSHYIYLIQTYVAESCPQVLALPVSPTPLRVIWFRGLTIAVIVGKFVQCCLP